MKSIIWTRGMKIRIIKIPWSFSAHFDSGFSRISVIFLSHCRPVPWLNFLLAIIFPVSMCLFTYLVKNSCCCIIYIIIKQTNICTHIFYNNCYRKRENNIYSCVCVISVYFPLFRYWINIENLVREYTNTHIIYITYIWFLSAGKIQFCESIGCRVVMPQCIMIYISDGEIGWR